MLWSPQGTFPEYGGERGAGWVLGQTSGPSGGRQTCSVVVLLERHLL